MQKKRTRDAFTHGKTSSKSQLIYLKILRETWLIFLKQTKRKKCKAEAV